MSSTKERAELTLLAGNVVHVAMQMFNMEPDHARVAMRDLIHEVAELQRWLNRGAEPIQPRAQHSWEDAT